MLNSLECIEECRGNEEEATSIDFRSVVMARRGRFASAV